MIRAALLVVVVILASPRGAHAEHEVYYRYVVLGYVKDSAGKPMAGAHVTLVRDKTDFSYLADTDGQGFYVLVARLGDESVGETLSLRIGSESTHLTARYDAANHTEARGTRVDVEGGRFVEHPAWFASTLARFLADPPR